MIESTNLYDSDIAQKIRLNAKKMENFVDNRPFNEIEIVLGFSSYIYWLVGLIRLEGTKKQDQYIETASESARAVALDFVAMIENSEILTKAIQEKIAFEPAKEIEWGLTKSENEEWKFSLTRAIILITRQLVYATLDYQDDIGKEDPLDKLDFLSYAELSDLYQEAILWASLILGVEAAQEIFVLSE
ncbi:MAG TPA: hypothetical protein GX522_09170 [Firmicutes bacterium]|nr:hypothetical protein [Bacillota bacterium]